MSSSEGSAEALAISVASSTLLIASASMSFSVASAKPKLDEPRAIQVDRIALQPFLELAFGPIFAGIGARVPAVAIGHRFDQRRAAAFARAVHVFHRRLIHLVGVVAVDHDSFEPVRRRAIGRRMLHRGHRADRRVFHVEVVLAHENHRQLPHGGEIERFVENAPMFVVPSPKKHTATCSVPRYCALHAAPAATGRCAPMIAYEPIAPLLDVGQVHRAAFAAEEAAFASHQLAEHAGHRRAARERVRVAAVGAERPVVGPHRDAERRRDRFLPERQMARAFDQVLQEEIVRALLAVAQLELQAVELHPRFLPDVDLGLGGFLAFNVCVHVSASGGWVAASNLFLCSFDLLFSSFFPLHACR